MIFCLRDNIIGHNGIVVINENEFDELKKATNILRNFYNATINYRIVVESYRAVEKAKHDAELDEILYSKFGYDEITNSTVILNSPIVGYLASSRYFLDSIDKILHKTLSTDQIQSFNKFRSDIYDSISEYKFIEALRNYVQHRELPIHSISHKMYVEDKKNVDASDLVSSLSLYAQKEDLQKDKKFKKKSLKDMPDQIDIIFCIRFHMEGIWKIHNYLIKTHSDIAENARTVISSAIERFKTNTGEKPIELWATAQEPDADVSSEFPLLLYQDDARRISLKKLGNLNNLHKRYVTGKIQKT